MARLEDNTVGASVTGLAAAASVNYEIMEPMNGAEIALEK
jgi:hypothetical protein